MELAPVAAAVPLALVHPAHALALGGIVPFPGLDRFAAALAARVPI